MLFNKWITHQIFYHVIFFQIILDYKQTTLHKKKCINEYQIDCNWYNNKKNIKRHNNKNFKQDELWILETRFSKHHEIQMFLRREIISHYIIVGLVVVVVAVKVIHQQSWFLAFFGGMSFMDYFVSYAATSTVSKPRHRQPASRNVRQLS